MRRPSFCYISLLYLSLTIKYVITKNNTCTPNEYRCDNGMCIDKSLLCDHHNDCRDSSDETNCAFMNCQAPDYFRCKNLKCVAKGFVCDRDNDCGDFSDEENCNDFEKNFLTNTTCSSEEWQCTDKLCIPIDWVCNGEPDCLDVSDETIGCSSTITCDGFKCKNGHCIVEEWRCDGHDDCHDNSDEENCDFSKNTTDCTLDNQRFLCSDNQTCIPLDKVCDNQPQCMDHSDESPWCHSPIKSCEHLGCSHNCVQLPTGGQCICPKGYHTLNDNNCQDINECETYGICDQKCKNLPGSHECLCDFGYFLKPDKKTCIARTGEPIMFFSMKSEIRAYLLRSELYYPVATKLRQVVGIKFDGNSVYWTDIFSEHESIVMANKDGSNRELLVTSGLGAPEDLDIDWVTGNIYFTDAERQHIGVCSRDGLHCAVIINKDIHKPRGIALHPEKGEMYWTDWGKRPEIARALMDGSQDVAFVSTEIHWPNGLTIDYPNERLYWTDAKIHTLESIRLDGTDRRVVLEGIVKHPYAIAVFEDRLFWSDWATHSIQSCHKFTGKDHHTLVKERKEFIYGIHIYHPDIHQKRSNPCSLSFCSDICLLSGMSYICACPQNKELSSDRHTCKEIEKKQMLILGTDSLLIHVEHQLLGKHEIQVLPVVVKKIGALTYNSLNNVLYISDLEINKIIALNLHTKQAEPLEIHDLGKITAMDFDYLGNNLYLCDEEKESVEVINLNTMARKVLLHDMHGEIPEAIALIPEEGVMFVSFKKHNQREAHVDRLIMDGTGRTHPIEHGLVGPISLLYDQDLHRIFVADAGIGNIETTSIEGDDRHGFRSLLPWPISIASLKTDIFWINKQSRRLYWGDKYNNDNSNKKITLDIPENITSFHLVSISPKIIGIHVCQHNNSGCSHLCLISQKNFVCACPSGMILGNDNKTCSTRVKCQEHEYFCSNSNMCVTNEKRCNKKKDCTFGEDEQNCNLGVECMYGHFLCGDGQCINETLRCDNIYHCKDKSDEHNCTNYDRVACPPLHLKCDDGKCVSERFTCDGFNDCSLGEDERNCSSITCLSTEFRCNSGACIPKNWECDNEFDCGDFSDEHSKCNVCKENSFKCTNNKCIDKSFVCDDENDCGDNSDEVGCNSKAAICAPGTISCSSNHTICVPLTALCNGTSECPHHEDEKDCTDCHIEEFTCENKKCIPTQWLCDRTDDCGDNSDESPELCLHNVKDAPFGTKHAVPCQDGFRCKNGNCIDFATVCDGRPDCYDNSDEGGTCSTACDDRNNPCEHECIRTPSGPVCKCKTGYELLGDEHHCQDINECQHYPPYCSQLCINRVGSYMCDCFDEFIIRSDKKSCKAKGKAMSLIFATDNQIRELSQTENTLKLLFAAAEMPRFSGLDISLPSDYLYFTIESTGSLQRLNMNTKTLDYMNRIGAPQKMAIDWITNNIYFINNKGESKSIDICNFNEKNCAKLVTLDVHRQISAMAIDPVNKVMFYSQVSWWIFNSPSYTIYRRYLDGTGSRELVKSTSGYVTGITYNPNKKILYYIDQHGGQLKQINYDGTMSTVIQSNLTRPTGLNFFEDHLYFLTAGGFMSKCQLFESLNCIHFKLHSMSSDLFVVAQESRQQIVDNMCVNHTCTHLCVPTLLHYKCLCEDGRLIQSYETCITKERTADNDQGPIVRLHAVHDDASSIESSSKTTISIIVPIGLILFAGAVYYLFKRRNSGNLNLSTIRFQNPGYGLDYNESAGKTLSTNTLDPSSHEHINPITTYEDERDYAERSNLLVNV